MTSAYQGGVQGLETLVSGAYIAMDPVTEGDARDEFIGLETPPVVTTAEEGTVYTLLAKELIRVFLRDGSPIP